MNRVVETYISEMEYRLEAPYRARAIIGDFIVSLVFAFAIAFYLLAF
jgi:hypothetical protein